MAIEATDTASSTKDALLDNIIAIDDSIADRLYPIGKLDAHIRNVRHKAISIFVFRDNKLLLQKRADKKYHSGGLWANTVCSHPRWNESSDACASRRMWEELGWAVPVRHFGQINYAAKVGDLFENEEVQCYFGFADANLDTASFNTDEVSATEWVTIPDILQRIKEKPALFTEWFKIYMAEHRSMIKSILT